MVPDIGGHPNAYFQVKNRSKWSKEFVDWLRSPHKIDEMIISDDDDDKSVASETKSVASATKKRIKCK